MLAEVTSRPVTTGLVTTAVSPDQWDELTACPVCEQASYVRDIAVIDGASRGAVASICTDCEHGFLRRRPTRSWFAKFYETDWDAQGRERTRSGPPTAHQDTKVLDFTRGSLAANARVLDVGAGYGATLLAFRNDGYAVRGVEASAHRAAYVRDVLGIPCGNSPIERIELSQEYDLVSLHHVLEHVFEPDQVLRTLGAALSPQGSLYIAVPDFWAEYPPQAFHFVPHLSWFTIRSLTRLLAKHNLVPGKVQVDREIQLLAVRAEPPAAPTEPETGERRRNAFLERYTRHVVDAFNGGRGRFTLAWHAAARAQVQYERYVFEGTTLVPYFLRMLRSGRRVVPRRVLRRALPGLGTALKPRALSLQVSGDPVLPVVVRHRWPDTAVWVK